MSSPIVVGFDPRSRILSPITFGAAAAELTGAPLIVVSVRGGDDSVHGAASDELGAGDGRRGGADLERVMPSGAEYREVEGHSAPRGLHRVAEETGAGLLVVAAGHRGRAARAVLGSTSERVVHGAPCAVAIVPEELESRRLGVVGVAYVPTPEGNEALHAAAVVASAAGARLRVLAFLKPEFGAVDGAHADPRGARPNEHREEAAFSHEAAMKAAVAEAVAAAPSVPDTEVEVSFGDPEQTLVDTSRHLDALVMGSRGYGPHKAVLLGGVSRRVTAMAECPVIVAPRGAHRPLEDLVTNADIAEKS